MFENKKLTPEQEVALKQAVGANVKAVENLLGRMPSFREYINHVFENLKVDREAFKPNFNGFMQGWQLNDFPKDDYLSIYNDMFDPTRESIEETISLFSQIFEQDDLIEKGNDEMKQIESKKKIEGIGGLFKKLSRINLFKLSSDEIIILSIITGTTFALVLGYIFGETQYFDGYGNRVSEYYSGFGQTTEHKFNFILGIASFIITAGIMYLFLNRKNKNDDK